MTENFKCGDKVQLISGGPTMTVSHYLGTGAIICVWYSNVLNEFKKLETWQNCLFSSD